MTVSRTTGALIGTSETSGVTLANNGVQTSSETDLLGNNTSLVDAIYLYLWFGSTVTAGSVDLRIWESRVTGEAAGTSVPIVASFSPINGTSEYGPQQIGRFRVGRFLTVSVTNNATAANLTNLFVGYELYVVS